MVHLRTGTAAHPDLGEDLLCFTSNSLAATTALKAPPAHAFSFMHFSARSFPLPLYAAGQWKPGKVTATHLLALQLHSDFTAVTCSQLTCRASFSRGNESQRNRSYSRCRCHCRRLFLPTCIEAPSRLRGVLSRACLRGCMLGCLYSLLASVRSLQVTFHLFDIGFSICLFPIIPSAKWAKSRIFKDPQNLKALKRAIIYRRDQSTTSPALCTSLGFNRDRTDRHCSPRVRMAVQCSTPSAGTAGVRQRSAAPSLKHRQTPNSSARLGPGQESRGQTLSHRRRILYR